MSEVSQPNVSSGGSGLIGGILGGIADLGNMFNNIYYSNKNYKMSKEQNEWNRGFSERQFQYAQDLQNRIFDREDTAVQRRVADLEGAGFNKLLSLGQGAQAGNIVSSNQASDMSAPQMNMRENKLDNTINMMSMVYNAMKQKQDISLSKTQEDKIRSDIGVNDSIAEKNRAEANNLNADTSYYSQRRNESNSNISRNNSYMNHLATQNDYLQQQIDESISRENSLNLDMTQRYYDFLMYNALGIPSGSYHVTDESKGVHGLLNQLYRGTAGKLHRSANQVWNKHFPLYNPANSIPNWKRR